MCKSWRLWLTPSEDTFFFFFFLQVKEAFDIPLSYVSAFA